MKGIEPASVRYRYDTPALYGVELLDAESASRALSQALSQNIRVSPLVLPRVYRTVVAAAQLVAPDRQITVFVHASPDINATCLIDQEDHVLVFVSSELIKLLDEPELRFVIGHELGHVVYEHFKWHMPSERDRTLRELELARAGEIAADRVGLLAARNIDAAASAMLKTASGLPSTHLEIDIAAYLRQARDLKRLDGDSTLAWSTHPPMLLRIRAALRFQTVLASMEAGHDALDELEMVDGEIFRELNQLTVGGQATELGRLAHDAAFWTAVSQACSDGVLSRSERASLERAFGAEKVGSLVHLLSRETAATAESFIRAKLTEFRSRLDEAPVAVERVSAELSTRYFARAHDPSSKPARTERLSPLTP